MAAFAVSFTLAPDMIGEASHAVKWLGLSLGLFLLLHLIQQQLVPGGILCLGFAKLQSLLFGCQVPDSVV